MLYNVINGWVTGKLALLNNTLPEADRLTAVNLNFDSDMLPHSLRDNSYYIKLQEISFTDTEAGEIKVTVNIEFHFRLYKKPAEFYKLFIDEKLYRLCGILLNDTAAGLEHTSNGITIANIHNISVSRLEKAYKGGEYIFPLVNFELQVFNDQ